MKIQLSKHFTLAEFIQSTTANRLAIDNTPSRTAIANLTNLALFVLQPLRDILNNPIRITSGYRTEQLNKAVGGKPTSQHLRGEAADIVISGEITRVPGLLQSHGIEFDQCIVYRKRNFIHLSFRMGNNRKEIIYN